MTRRWCWLAAFVVVSRLPAFVWGTLNIDESDFLVIGRMIGRGAIPYVDFAEKKPLLAYAFYTPAAVTGYAMWPMQLLAIACIVGTAALIARAVDCWTHDARIAWSAAWLVALAYAGTMPGINLELLANLPVAAAIYFHLRGDRDLLAGLAVGLAIMIKQQAGITLFVLHAGVVWQGGRLRLDRHARMLAGCALPWLTAIAVYAAIGHVGAFYEWNIERNLGYSEHAPGSALWRFADGALNCIVMSVPMHWYLAVRGGGGAGGPVRGTLLAGLALTWIPVALGGRFYPHYFMQFIPWLAALAAPPAVELLRTHRRLAIALFAAPLAFYLVDPWIRGATDDYPSQDAKTNEVARWLDANTSPDDTLFVWGHYAPIYVSSNRLPGTRYFTTAVHVGDFDPAQVPDDFDARPYVSARDIARTLDDLERNRVPIIVDTAPANIHAWGKFPLAIAPALDAYVHAHYDLVGRPAGAAVYRRR